MSRIGDPLDLLDLLAADGCEVQCRPDGKLVVRRLPRWATLVHPSSWQLVAAVLAGRATGHAWTRCDRRGEGRMVRVGARPPCAMTPGCEGYHEAAS
jgi:hypothetical protein